LLPSSRIEIPLSPSSDYLKGLILVHGVAIIAVCMSSLSWPVSVLLFSGLMGYLCFILRQKGAHTSCQHIVHYGDVWIIKDHRDHETRYDHAKITLSGGFFLLLQLEFADNSSSDLPRDVGNFTMNSKQTLETKSDEPLQRRWITKHQKTLVIFKDQMTLPQYRALRLCLLRSVQ